MEKLENIIFYTMDKSIRSYRMFAQKRLKENGFQITIDQWLIIKVLMENPGISQQELSELVFKDGASVTRIIDLLVKSNYLERKINKNDRRKSNLKITPSGKKIIENVQKVVLENRRTALNTVSEKDLETVQQVLVQIIENCKKD
jgi:DNA-binding MarR family transcriptional regulator